MAGGKKVKTPEHKAWEILKARVDYLNTFAGNRSQMREFTKMVEEAEKEGRVMRETGQTMDNVMEGVER